MMDHRETAADGVYRTILYNLLCFASVPVFIFGGAARKVAGINYPNSITESCHGAILHCVKTGPKRQQAPAMKLFHYARSPFWETLKFLI